MRLYVIDKDTRQKLYIGRLASTRQALVGLVGSKEIEVQNKKYRVQDVLAEKSGENAPVSTVLGGALGLVGGMPGVIIGGILGAALGSDKDRQEDQKVKVFNESVVQNEQ